LVQVEGLSGTQLRAATVDDGLASGDSVLAAIRPENLELHRAAEGPRQNTLRTTVERVLYLGSECELLLRFEELVYTLRVSRHRVPRLGPEVDLHFPPEPLRVWADMRPHRMSAAQPTPRPTSDAATTPAGPVAAGSGL